MTIYRVVMFADVLFRLPTPAEASGQNDRLVQGFAQAGKPAYTFPGHALISCGGYDSRGFWQASDQIDAERGEARRDGGRE
jgi:hypothetical protein